MDRSIVTWHGIGRGGMFQCGTEKKESSDESKEIWENEEWELVLDENGEPVITYLINNSEVSKEDYFKFAERNDEKFKQQLVPNDEDQTFIEYLDGAEMLKLLK